MDEMRKLMAKKQKEGKTLSPMEQKAKLSVLGHMHDMASDEMAKKMSPLHKVSVMSDSEEGLEHGLDKAKDVLGHLPEALDDSNPDHEAFEHSENEEDGEDGMSAYPDDGDDHDLEADPEHAQAMAEHEQGEDDEDMPEHEIDAKLEKLMALKKKKGMKA